MGKNFDSFKNYIDKEARQANMSDLEKHSLGPETALETYFREVDYVNDDIERMEVLYTNLDVSNEEIKAATSAKALMLLQSQTNSDISDVVRLAKQIDKKIDCLVRVNAAKRKVPGSEPGSDDDLARGSRIVEIRERLKEIKDQFQELRVRMESDHRQVIETRYMSMTGEKATEDAIEKLGSHKDIGDFFKEAVSKHGRIVVLDMVTEMQERREAMRDVRKTLMSLHQILIGMSTPLESQARKSGASTQPNSLEFFPGDPHPIHPLALFSKFGLGRLNDYEKDTKRVACVAMVIAAITAVVIIVMYLKYESKLENGKE